MKIRLAEEKDLPEIVTITEDTRRYFRSHNIPQWLDGYPSEADFRKDIEEGALYVATENGEVLSFYAQFGYEPTYDVIEGKWLDDSPYVVIHRMAVKESLKGRGIAGKVFDAIKKDHPHIRIDTHEDNLSMRRCVEKNGFVYCGVITLLNGDPRFAYEYIRK
jgi:ribosomal protein S18 acetylase RimI-like enzyme